MLIFITFILYVCYFALGFLIGRDSGNKKAREATYEWENCMRARRSDNDAWRNQAERMQKDYERLTNTVPNFVPSRSASATSRTKVKK